ncbi:MAG TPA: hypothetical protein VGI19_12775 [Candidatus Cybelea sp.]|jgi:hypothetical protein
MKTRTLFGYAVGIAGSALFLAGCSSGGSSPASGLPLPGASGVADARTRFHPHLRWAAPDLAKTPRLLFLSDNASGNINIYSMPDLKLKAQFNPIGSDLQGECPDTNGAIYVTNAGSGWIGEVNRAGELWIPTYGQVPAPFSCAVNPINREVAVTSNGSSGGNIRIFRPTDSGYRSSFSVPHMQTYFFDGYDRRGNLWVDGYTKNSTSIVATCSGSRCRTIPISGGTIYQPGFVQYAVGQKTWYVADRKCGGRRRFCIYPVSAGGVLGKKITLTDAHGKPVCDMFQGAITDAGSRVIVGGVDNGLVKNCGVTSVARWNFPAGDDPTHGTNDVGASPSGAAISAKAGGI